jgi:mannose-6-phosphate isomerase
MRKKLVKKPWGNFEQFTLNEKCTVKILNVLPKKRLSLQSHNHRKEFWKVLKGPVKIQIGNKKIKAPEGKEFIIDPKTKHRLEGLDKEGKVLEISFGKFSEKDITRLEDDFNRN